MTCSSRIYSAIVHLHYSLPTSDARSHLQIAAAQELSALRDQNRTHPFFEFQKVVFPSVQNAKRNKNIIVYKIRTSNLCFTSEYIL